MITRENIQRMWTDGERLFTLSYGAIHWPELDEDLTIDGMFRAKN